MSIIIIPCNTYILIEVKILKSPLYIFCPCSYLRLYLYLDILYDLIIK